MNIFVNWSIAHLLSILCLFSGEGRGESKVDNSDQPWEGGCRLHQGGLSHCHDQGDVFYLLHFQERRVTRVVRKGHESDESDDERGEVEDLEGKEGEGSGPSETGTYTVEEKEEPGNQVRLFYSLGSDNGISHLSTLALILNLLRL